MRIYIESTIPSYVVARPARDLLQAARQQLTRDLWDLKREHHELFTSQVVLDEIAFGEKAMAQLRLELLQSVPLLPVTEEVKQFAGKVLASWLLPATADRDAAHIVAHELDLPGVEADPDLKADRQDRARHLDGAPDDRP